MTGYRSSFDEAGKELAERIEESVVHAVADAGRVAVAFSGGLDSSILVAAAKPHTQVFACSAHAEGSHDERATASAAKALGVELKVTRLTRDLVGRELEGVRLPFEPTLMDRSLWCLYSIVSQRAAEGGAKVILLGQLADELFGGYAKYQRTLTGDGEFAAKSLMGRDVDDYLERGIRRDTHACSRWMRPNFPFTEKSIVELGLSMPISYKIRDGVRKAVLREAGANLGVPEELLRTAKKAAQYSSGIQKLAGQSTF